MTPVAPGELLPAFRALPPGTLVVLDFDGTLLHGNSTSLFLRSLRPAPVARAVLAVLDVLRPWRWARGPDPAWAYRDWIRVVLLSVLLPWSVPLWRRGAGGLGAARRNRALVAAVRAAPHCRFVVATYGFRILVAPLLRAMDVPAPLLVAAGFGNAPELRRRGKARAVANAAGSLAGAVVVTDSADDADFVPWCRTVLLLPPRPEPPPPATGGYLPLRYLHRCKRAGENTVLRVVLFYDLLALWLAYAAGSARPVPTAAGLVFFQLAFWTVYELGNWENDVLGARWEVRPHIPDGFARWRDRVRPRQAWAWACGLLVPASLLLAAGLVDDPFGAGSLAFLPLPVLAAALWVLLLAYLGASRGVYALYNRTDPLTRVWLYPLMQVSKALGLAALLPAATAGLILLVSVVAARQLRYAVYRYGNTRTAFAIPVNLHTLAVFVLLSGAFLALVGPVGRAFWVTAGFVVLWHLQRARHELQGVVNGVRWLPGAPAAVREDASAPP